MTNTNAQADVTPAHSAGMRGEIAAKWGKFTAAEISALKDKDDLISQVQVKYNLDKVQAGKDVEAIAKGRQL